VFNENMKEDMSGHKCRTWSLSTLVDHDPALPKNRWNCFRSFVCAPVCVCICMSVLWMVNSNQTWDSSQDNSFTAWTSLFLHSYHYQKEGKLQSSFIQLRRKRI